MRMYALVLATSTSIDLETSTSERASLSFPVLMRRGELLLEPFLDVCFSDLDAELVKLSLAAWSQYDALSH